MSPWEVLCLPFLSQLRCWERQNGKMRTAGATLVFFTSCFCICHSEPPVGLSIALCPPPPKVGQAGAPVQSRCLFRRLSVWVVSPFCRNQALRLQSIQTNMSIMLVLRWRSQSVGYHSNHAAHMSRSPRTIEAI